MSVLILIQANILYSKTGILIVYLLQAVMRRDGIA
jgi:hypothetical protein